MEKNGVRRLKHSGALGGVREDKGIFLYVVVGISLLGKTAVEQKLEGDEGQTSGKRQWRERPLRRS